MLQKRIKAGPGITHIHHRAPLCNHHHQRRQHPPTQHRAHDQHTRATGQLVIQQQPGRQPQQQRAHGRLQKLADCLESSRMVRSPRLQAQKLTLLFLPAAVNVPQHPHRLNHLRIAQRVVCIGLGPNRAAVGLQHVGRGAALIQNPHRHLQDGAQHGRPTKPRAHQKQQRHENQRNGRLHHCTHRRARQKFANGAQVVHGLNRSATQATQIARVNAVKHPVGQYLVEQLARLVHRFRARPVQRFHHHIGGHHHQRQHPQRHVAAAVHHAVVHLQHVHRGHQHQQPAQQRKTKRPPVKRRERQHNHLQLGRGFLLTHATSSTIKYSGISPGAASSCAPSPDDASASPSQKLNTNVLPPSRVSTISRSLEP